MYKSKNRFQIVTILSIIFCSFILFSSNLNYNNAFAELSGTIKILQDPITITSITADDPDGGDSIFSNGDTIIVTFSGDTNKPDVATKSDLDTLFTFLDSLGANYSGSWKNSQTLIITIQDSAGHEDPTVGIFTMTLKSAGNLKVAGGQSLASTDESPVLQGSFGDRAGPYMTSILADDPDNGDSIFSNGDTIIVKFSEDTNEPDVATKANLDTLFAYQSSLGTDYGGSWKNPQTLIITMVDSASAGPPAVNTFDMTLKSGGNLKVAGGQSLESTGTSPKLQGSFGTFSRTLFADKDEVVTTVLPAGTTVEIKLPVAGGMEITRTSASTSIDDGTIKFVGDVIDITPVNGASCTSGCIILFLFTQDDLAGQDPSDVSIFHDTNGDGNFSQNEKLSTVITEDSSNVFTANATTFSNSKFTAATTSFPPSGGGGGGGGDRTEPTLQSNLLASPDSNIYGGTLKLDDSAKNSASIFETGDTVDLELSFYENSGTESLAHVTLFTNIRGNDDRYDSNLYVEWNKGKPLKVYDSEGYLDDDTSVSFAKHDSNIVMIFHLNFIKPMDVSHIVLNFWDYNRNDGLVTFNDAWQILEPIDTTMLESENDDLAADKDTVNDLIDIQQKEDPPTIPPWIKNNARWWADGKIEDSIFINGIQHMLQIRGDVSNVVNTSIRDEFEITSEEKRIPNWIKNSAKWWSEDLISEDEFVNALQWLVSKEIIKG